MPLIDYDSSSIKDPSLLSLACSCPKFSASFPALRPPNSTPFSISGRASALHKRVSRAPTIIPRTSAITRAELGASAERIYFRYLAPPTHTADAASQNHEIYLPPALRIHSFPLSSTREPRTPDEAASMAQIPDMFHAQKEYCFRAME